MRSQTAFSVVAITFVLLTLGGTIPIPLYVLYAQEYGFGAGITTLIFAIYVIGTLASLIFFGALSDQLGRKRFLVIAVLITIVSGILFALAQGVAMLLAARLLSGLGVGLGMPVATTMLAEVYPGRQAHVPPVVATVANMGGLGLGPLIGGLFARYGPSPTTLVYVCFCLALVLDLLFLWRVPETVRPLPGTEVRWAPRFGVPRSVRPIYLTVALGVFPTFTLLGLFSSLTPSFLREVLKQNNVLVAGAATFVLFELGVLAQLFARRRSPRAVIIAGLPLLVISLVAVLAGLLRSAAVLFAAGPIVGGIAAGLVFMGGLEALSAAVSHDHHAGTVTAYFTAAQAGLAVPVLIIGALSGTLGTLGATTVVITAIAVISVLALIRALRWPTGDIAPAGPERPRRRP